MSREVGTHVPFLLTPSGGHLACRKAGTTHPTEMLSCYHAVFGEIWPNSMLALPLGNPGSTTDHNLKNYEELQPMAIRRWSDISSQ